MWIFTNSDSRDDIIGVVHRHTGAGERENEQIVRPGADGFSYPLLAEGRNREVRRMIEAAGARVSRLMRVRFGPISLPFDLPPCRCVEVDSGNTQNLIQTARN